MVVGSHTCLLPLISLPKKIHLASHRCGSQQLACFRPKPITLHLPPSTRFRNRDHTPGRVNHFSGTALSSFSIPKPKLRSFQPGFPSSYPGSSAVRLPLTIGHFPSSNILRAQLRAFTNSSSILSRSIQPSTSVRRRPSPFLSVGLAYLMQPRDSVASRNKCRQALGLLYTGVGV